MHERGIPSPKELLAQLADDPEFQRRAAADQLKRQAVKKTESGTFPPAYALACIASCALIAGAGVLWLHAWTGMLNSGPHVFLTHDRWYTLGALVLAAFLLAFATLTTAALNHRSIAAPLVTLEVACLVLVLFFLSTSRLP